MGRKKTNKPVEVISHAPNASTTPAATALNRILRTSTREELELEITNQLRTSTTRAPFIFSIANYPSFLSLAEHIKRISPEYFEVFCIKIAQCCDSYNLIGFALLVCDAPLLQYLLGDCKMSPYGVDKQQFSSISTLLRKICSYPDLKWLAFFNSIHDWLVEYIKTYNARRPAHEPMLAFPFDLQIISVPKRVGDESMSFIFQDSDNDDEEEKTPCGQPMELCALAPLAAIFAEQGFEFAQYLFQNVRSNWLQQLHHYDYDNGYPLSTLLISGYPGDKKQEWRDLSCYVAVDKGIYISDLLEALEDTISLSKAMAARPARVKQETVESMSRMAFSSALSMPKVLFDLVRQMEDIVTPSIKHLHPQAQHIALLLNLNINHCKTVAAILSPYTEKNTQKHSLLTQMLNTYVLTRRLSNKPTYPSHLLPVANPKMLKTISNQLEFILKLFPNKALLLSLINKYEYWRIHEIQKLVMGFEKKPLASNLPSVRMLAHHPSASSSADAATAAAHSTNLTELSLAIKCKMNHVALLIDEAREPRDFTEAQKELLKLRALVNKASEERSSDEQQHTNKTERLSQKLLMKQVNQLIRSIRIIIDKETASTSERDALLSKLNHLIDFLPTNQQAHYQSVAAQLAQSIEESIANACQEDQAQALEILAPADDTTPRRPLLEIHHFEASDSKRPEELEEDIRPNILFDYGTYLFQLQGQLKHHYAELLLLSAATPVEKQQHHRQIQKGKELIACLFLETFGRHYDRLVDNILKLADLESQTELLHPSLKIKQLRQSILMQINALPAPDASSTVSASPITPEQDINLVRFQAFFTRWNEWVSHQLEQLDYWNNVLKEQSDENIIHMEQMPDALLIRLHQGFQPTRVLHLPEQQVHERFLALISSIKDELSIRFGDSIEHSTQVIDYLLPGVKLPRSDFDIMTQIIVDCAIPQTIQNILNFLNHLLESDSAHPVLISPDGVPRLILSAVTAKSAYGEQNSFHIELEFRDANRHYSIDWVISNAPHQHTLDGRILPIAMMGYNLCTGTVFNPLNHLTAAQLLQPSGYSNNALQALNDEEKQALMNKPSAIAFIIRTIGNLNFNIRHSPLTLAADTLNLIKCAIKRTEWHHAAPYSTSNCLTVLFGKPSLNIARFHQLIIDQQLTSIFQLEKPEHSQFLEWINQKLQRLEQDTPGATRCYVGLVSSIDYVALMLSRVLLSQDINGIYHSIALRCLAPRFAHAALELAQQIAQGLLHGKVNEHPIIRINKTFHLTDFYTREVPTSSAHNPQRLLAEQRAKPAPSCFSTVSPRP